MLHANFYVMKNALITLALTLSVFIIIPLRAHAENVPFLCAGDTIIVNDFNRVVPVIGKTQALTACMEYIVANNKTGSTLEAREKDIQTGEARAGGFSYNANFCWCSVPGNSTSCVPKVLFAANDSAACDSRCSEGGAVAVRRHFEPQYKDYRGTTNSNKCGNYCWCSQPAAAGETGTRCTLHRDTPKRIGAQEVRVPLTERDECSALCNSIAGGSAKQYQMTYRNYSGSSDCSVAEGSVPDGSDSVTPRTTTPAPTVRLFNPLSGATTIVDIVNRVIKMMLGVVGGGALLMFVYGGFSWMMAGGDTGKLSTAKTILLNATLGILLLIFSYAIVSTFFSLLT